jgi:hypothetical protein
MSILSRNALKSEFTSGTAATSSKFEDVFDSTYNLKDDSVLLGPVGITGSYGILGPDGGTYNGLIGPTGSTFFNGLWMSSGSTPGSSASAGKTGETIIKIIGPSANVYIHNGTQWIKIEGISSF